VVSILTLLVTIPLIPVSTFRLPWQFVEGRMSGWRPFNIHYHLGVDGISLLLILLTASPP